MAHKDASPALTGRRLISADRVQGTPVYDRAGDKLGHVEDIMLHKISGKVAYAIMSFGGVLGIGEKYHPVPWSMLTYDPDKGGYVAPLTKESLEAAPTLEQSDIDMQDDASWGERVRTHYGAPGPFI